MDSARARLVALARRAAPYRLALALSSIVAYLAIKSILDQAGRPAAPLDDSFIHFQYARRLAEGHFFSYTGDAGYTTGATSLLWPMLLAPFYAIGFKRFAIVEVAWLFGTLAHAATAVEAYRLTHRLAGRAAALGAGAMCLAFGAYAWFAWSGMETVELAWILLRTARVAGDYAESRSAPRPVDWKEVAVLGVLSPLVRPEGVLASVIAAIAIARRSPGKSRLRALVPLAGPLVVPLLHLALAGHATSSTTMVKWLFANPAYDRVTAWSFTLQNAHLLLTNILDGGEWTTIFLPEGSSYVILLGAVALPIASMRRRAPWTGLFVMLVALGTLLPCSYLSFLWNRVRYVWPFAGAWFVGVACLARELGDLVRIVAPRMTALTPALAGGCAALLATKLGWSIHDLGQSARAIDRQQVTLGEWAHEHLPSDAVIGVNDTGAIAYFSGRKTFDVCGLTTEGEARYWVSGAGARFEHYESMDRPRLPTHFIVYPGWMAMPAVLGEELTHATVTEQSILGGTTMEAHVARWDLLGTGARPTGARSSARVVDEVDVADLASEAAHHYQLFGARDGDCVAMKTDEDAWEDIPRVRLADGGRANRALDELRVKIEPGVKQRLVARLSSEDEADVDVIVGDAEPAPFRVSARDWQEIEAVVPPDAGPEITIRVGARKGTFASYHYWVIAE